MSSEEPQKKYYKANIVDEQPLDVPSGENSFAKELLEDSKDGKTFGVMLESDIVIQRIARELYPNPLAGFREIFNNATRFVKIANREHGAHGKVHIILNPIERKMVVHEIDSMGISVKEFRETYKWLGRSDNFDRTESGQFGFGKAAILCLCDAPKFEIKSRLPEPDGPNKGKKAEYVVMSLGGTKWQPITTENPEIDDYGMRITMTCYEDIEFDKLFKYITDAVRFKGVETYVTLEEDIDDDIHFLDANYEERTAVKGMYKIGPFSMKEYVDRITPSKRDEDDDQEEARFRLPVEIDSKDFYFYGVILASKQEVIRVSGYNVSYLNLDNRVFLIGSPISIKNNIKTGPISYWLLDVKDEGKYPPAANREQMKEDDKTMEPIREAISNKIGEVLSFLNITSIEEFKESPERALIMHEELEPYLDETTKDIVEFLRWSVIVDTSGRREKLGHMDLNKLLYSRKLSNWITKPIQEYDESITVFRFKVDRGTPEYREQKFEEGEARLKKHGIKWAAEFAKQHKLRFKRGPSSDSGIEGKTGFDVWFYTHADAEEVELLTPNIVKVPADKMAMYKGAERGDWSNGNHFLRMIPTEANCECGITRSIKRLKTGGSTIDEFIKRHENVTLVTNMGKEKLIDIFRSRIQQNKVVYIPEEPEVVVEMPTKDDEDKKERWILAPTKEIQWAVCFYFFTRSEGKENQRIEIVLPQHARLQFYRATIGAELFWSWNNVDLLKKIKEVARQIKDESLRKIFIYAAKEEGQRLNVEDADQKGVAKLQTLFDDVLRVAQKASGVVTPTKKKAIEIPATVNTELVSYKLPDWINKDRLTNSDAIATLLYDLKEGFTTGQIAQMLTVAWEPKHLKNISREVTSKGKDLRRYVSREKEAFKNGRSGFGNKLSLTSEGRKWYETEVLPRLKGEKS